MMPYFRSQPPAPRLPEGYGLVMEGQPVDAPAVNRFLQHCGAPARSDSIIARALEASAWTVRLLHGDQLVGFVRVTSDQALNANLWNLAARPGPDQGQLLAVLVHRALHILRRDLPGCSLSVSAPEIAINSLKEQGFVIDPSGIRAMGLRLKPTSD